MCGIRARRLFALFAGVSRLPRPQPHRCPRRRYPLRHPLPPCPQTAAGPAAAQVAQAASAGDAADLPQAPSAERFPYAVPVPQPGDRKVVLESNRQTRNGDIVTLDGDVHIQYGEYRVEADHIEYNDATGDVTASGHLHITGTTNNETLSASHGTLNIHDETGRFFDVQGSVGVRTTLSAQAKPEPLYTPSASGSDVAIQPVHHGRSLPLYRAHGGQVRSGRRTAHLRRHRDQLQSCPGRTGSLSRRRVHVHVTARRVPGGRRSAYAQHPGAVSALRHTSHPGGRAPDRLPDPGDRQLVVKGHRAGRADLHDAGPFGRPDRRGGILLPPRLAAVCDLSLSRQGD